MPKPVTREKREWRKYLQELGLSFTSAMGLLGLCDKYGVEYDLLDWMLIDPTLTYSEQKAQFLPFLKSLAPKRAREIEAEKLVEIEAELPTTKEGLKSILYSVFAEEKNGEFISHLKSNIDTIIDIASKDGVEKEYATKFILDKLPEILSEERKKFGEERKKLYEEEAKSRELERKLKEIPTVPATKEIAELRKEIDKILERIEEVKEIARAPTAPPIEIKPIPLAPPAPPVSIIQAAPTYAPEVDTTAHVFTCPFDEVERAKELNPAFELLSIDEQGELLTRAREQLIAEGRVVMRSIGIEEALKTIIFTKNKTTQYLFPVAPRYWETCEKHFDYFYGWINRIPVRLYKYIEQDHLISREDLRRAGIPLSWINDVIAEGKKIVAEKSLKIV